MTEPRDDPAQDQRVAHRQPAPPLPAHSWALATASMVVVAASYWLALRPGADAAQTDLARWLNDPPPPFGAVLAVTNSLFRPVPLAVLAAALASWILATTRGSQRWEVLRAAVVSVVLTELGTQVLKRVADQPRPTASIPDLDVHGYPKNPYGNAYPSAHTAVAVGLVAALWPWLTRSQRAVGVVVALLVALNRLYIGAHWPVDVVGGAAIGLLSGALCWLVAARWPIASGPGRSRVAT
ncbi:MAG: phosphatase PAP2 family protein [Ornithinibacter sp.]